MGNAMSRRPQTIPEILQRILDRLGALEARRSINLGEWVLKETADGRVLLTHPASGTTKELAPPPTTPEETPNEPEDAPGEPEE